MELKDAIEGRRSIRGYKPDPVSRDLLEEIIALANRAPSSMNTQPWHFHVITGDVLDQVRKGNSEKMLAGEPPRREIEAHRAYEGIHRERQVEIAKQLFAAMGIEREDKARRQDWVMRGFRQFDAPVSVVVTYDRPLLEHGPVAIFDAGAATYGLVLAAWDRGLGAVINGQGIMQSPVVREAAKIPEDEIILTCVALGWPDEEFEANAVRSTRRDVGETASFLGFDD
ncbi:nitroreductase [Rhodalgimonas zhirmunskyi]|uniref:Nitroreductase n=1 Tax=Rhodalgimonas zhirmunskyi TaxID=2964767 RepID=A0AAJ1U8Q6_9RHOB|nr:nitroreductase [Rhodoalgimonas zhirmunskyi]MDQ2095680.1 nitroreductase [Rhodoalgimonas zhirmunskyi]